MKIISHEKWITLVWYKICFTNSPTLLGKLTEFFDTKRTVPLSNKNQSTKNLLPSYIIINIWMAKAKKRKDLRKVFFQIHICIEIT